MPKLVAKNILSAAQVLSQSVSGMVFSPEATHVYNPLEYAWEPYRQYVERFANSRKKVVFLGMNPGPFGMAQTGVAFGEIPAVRDWMGIYALVGKPSHEHPSRPVEGFACTRSEVSGRRLWGLFAERFGNPEAFFKNHFVLNYCPLLFLDGSGKGCRNLTPDKLPAAKTQHLYAACDTHLRAVITALEPEWVIGVGQFAMKKSMSLLGDYGCRLGAILHPSPASPAANRGWAEQATRQMTDLGIW